MCLTILRHCEVKGSAQWEDHLETCQSFNLRKKFSWAENFAGHISTELIFVILVQNRKIELCENHWNWLNHTNLFHKIHFRVLLLRWSTWTIRTRKRNKVLSHNCINTLLCVLIDFLVIFSNIYWKDMYLSCKLFRDYFPFNLSNLSIAEINSAKVMINDLIAKTNSGKFNFDN